jgi:cobalt/nickel transport system permease protein
LPMTFVFTPPPCTVSPLSRLDPRWKLAAITLAGLVAAVIHTPRGAAAALVGALILAVVSRLPWRWCVLRLAPVLLFVAFFAVPVIFIPAKAGPLWQLGPATLSASGAATALVLLCKAAALVLLALVVLATAPLDATLKAAHALHVPGLLVQLTLLSYRYAFVLADELGRLRIAVRVRGYRNRANLHSYRTIGAVTGAILVRGWERGERVGHAMRCRGFDGRFRSLSAFRTTAADVLMFFVITCGAVGVCLLDCTR